MPLGSLFIRTQTRRSHELRDKSVIIIFQTCDGYGDDYGKRLESVATAKRRLKFLTLVTSALKTQAAVPTQTASKSRPEIQNTPSWKQQLTNNARSVRPVMKINHTMTAYLRLHLTSFRFCKLKAMEAWQARFISYWFTVRVMQMKTFWGKRVLEYRVPKYAVKYFTAERW